MFPISSSGPQRPLQSIEHDVGPRRPRCSPANDAACADVDNEGDLDRGLPGRDKREITYERFLGRPEAYALSVSLSDPLPS